ncbi:MAG: MBL fold metallo-hydrolase [Clostridia bacterium]|nr:MBL fold metallo-hydrolase [Clostridia bacterium]
MKKANRFDALRKSTVEFVPASGQTVQVDLADYVIVSPRDFHADAMWRVEELASRLQIPICDGTEEAPHGREILIGNTGRAESDAAKQEIKGAGCIVRVTDDKIVICGTTNYLTQLGLKHFTEQWLTGATGTVITLPVCTVCQELTMLSLADDELCNYALVYDNDLDDDGGNCPEPHGPGNREQNPDQVDFAVHACNRIGELLVKLTGCEATSVSVIPDVDSAQRELLMGNTDRERVQEILSELAVNEYGIFTDDKNIMVLAWNDTALMKAYGLFATVLRDSFVTDAKGYKTYYLPAFLTDRYSFETNWVTDFPKPEARGLTLSETVDVHDDSLEYIYLGEGVTAKNYRTYCKKLTESGYTLYSENDIEGNLFSTYVNREQGVTLHVTLALFPHAQDYDIRLWPKNLRVVSAPLSSVCLIGKRELEPRQIYTRLTDTMLTSVEQDRPAKSVLGNFYVLTLEDGSFFIVDGGQNRGTIGTDYYLWNVLNKLYERTHGHKPTGEDPIVIAGWLLTHAHDDHIGTLKAFCRRYSDPQYPLRFEYFFANLMSESEHFNVCGVVPVQTWESLLGDFAQRVNCVKLHSGDRFYLRNAAFEVLYTHEDMHPFMLDYYNESSTVLRIDLRHMDGKGNEIGVPVGLLSTGDMNRYTGKNMLAMYGSYLQTEMMTVAHHGWVGPKRLFYDVVSPKILWWPTFIKDFQYMTKEGQQNNSWYHLRVDYYIAHDLASVKYIFVQDTYDTTLILGKNGIDYDNILPCLFDLIDEKRIDYNEDTVIKK